MSNADIIRAWKDPEYRSTLSVVPISPAGRIELSDPALGGVTVPARGFRRDTVRHEGTGWICGFTNDECHTLILTTTHCCR